MHALVTAFSFGCEYHYVDDFADLLRCGRFDPMIAADQLLAWKSDPQGLYPGRALPALLLRGRIPRDRIQSGWCLQKTKNEALVMVQTVIGFFF